MPNLTDFRAYLHADESDPVVRICYLYACQQALDAGIPAWRFYASDGAGDPKLNAYIYAVAGAEYDNRNHEFASAAQEAANVHYRGIARRELMSPTAAPEGAKLFAYDLSEPLEDMDDLAGRKETVG